MLSRTFTAEVVKPFCLPGWHDDDTNRGCNTLHTIINTSHKCNAAQPNGHLELILAHWAKWASDLSFATKKIWCCQRQSRAEASSGISKTAPHPNIFVLKKKNIQNLKRKIIFQTAITSWRAKDYEDVLVQLPHITLYKIEATFH